MKWNNVDYNMCSSARMLASAAAWRYALVMALMMTTSTSTRAAGEPVLIAYDEINFGKTLFVSGSCTMNHLDGSFTFTSPDAMCGSAGNGTPGHYLIITQPHKQVRVKILQRDNEGDGFIFIPSGELISDAETVAITPNVAQDISAGAAGSVRIRVGGQLLITSQTTPSTSFNLIKVDGIEWSILP